MSNTFNFLLILWSFFYIYFNLVFFFPYVFMLMNFIILMDFGLSFLLIMSSYRYFGSFLLFVCFATVPTTHLVGRFTALGCEN